MKMGSPLLKPFDKVDACLNSLMPGAVLKNTDELWLDIRTLLVATEKFVSFYVRIISIYHQQPTENVIMSNKCTFFFVALFD